MNDEFVDRKKAQREAGDVSRTTLWRWCRDGHFPRPYWLGPHTPRWKRSEIQDWKVTRSQNRPVQLKLQLEEDTDAD